MGSITLDRSGTSITLTQDLVVQRSAGRPNAELQPTAADDRPKYIDKIRPANDEFEISGAFLSDSAESDAQTLAEDILLPTLGRSSLTLTFDGSLFALGSFNVVPFGGQSGRVSWTAGETGIVRVSALSLRVVDNS